MTFEELAAAETSLRDKFSGVKGCIVHDPTARAYWVARLAELFANAERARVHQLLDGLPLEEAAFLRGANHVAFTPQKKALSAADSAELEELCRALRMSSHMFVGCPGHPSRCPPRSSTAS